MRMRWGVCCALILFVGACDCAPQISRALAITTGPTLPRVDGGGIALTPKSDVPREVRALSDAFANAAQAIRPSVVRLDVEVGVRGTGSGVIIDAAGHVLTTSHVTHGATKVTIRLMDRRSFPGKVVGTDLLTDIGVVKFEAPPSGLVAARLGNSDKLRVGEWSIAVGSPLGMDQTVTAGIIGGVGETGSDFGFEPGSRIRKYIQTDAKINPGNSGGPLVNLEGEVVGINTVINVGPGGSYGFAIPINQAAQVAEALIKEGRIRYPYIGINVMDLADVPEELRRVFQGRLPQKGAVIAQVMPGGPAAQVGLRAGDVITHIDERAVETANDVAAALLVKRTSGTISIGYLRDETSRTIQVEIWAFAYQSPLREGGQSDR